MSIKVGPNQVVKSTRPTHAFEPRKGVRHLGAFELALRYSQLRVDPNAFASPKGSAQKASEVGFGLNWYLNKYVKLTTDYEHTVFTMSSSSVTPSHNEDVLMNRVQLAF